MTFTDINNLLENDCKGFNMGRKQCVYSPYKYVKHSERMEVYHREYYVECTSKWI